MLVKRILTLLIILVGSLAGAVPIAVCQINPLSSVQFSSYPAVPAVPITVTAVTAGNNALYSFDFGDGSLQSGWSNIPSRSHTYSREGHYSVVVQTQDESGFRINRRTIVVKQPFVHVSSTSSTSVAVDNAGNTWVVNPDNDSVSIVGIDGTLSEVALGDGCSPRNVALDQNQTAWITCHRSDALKLVTQAQTIQTLPLPYGSGPHGILANPRGDTLYVTYHSSGKLAAFASANLAQTALIGVGSTPRAMAMSGDGRRLLITRYISGDSKGEVWDFEIRPQDGPVLTGTIPLLEDDLSPETTQSGRGIPNYLAGISIDPSGKRAWVVGKKDNHRRGKFLSGTDLNQENSVRAIAAKIDLVASREVFDERIDLDNVDSPTSIAFSPLGDYAFISAQGNNQVLVYDNLSTAKGGTNFIPPLIQLKTGSAPQGLIFDAVRNRLISNNFLTRSLTFFNLEQFLLGMNSNPVGESFPSIINEKLPENVRLGKQIFYNASDGLGPNGRHRMSGEGYISCATCHADGSHDGRTWDFTGRGEGLRNTTDLRGRRGIGHGRVHWSANFDEIQDFENDIRNFFGGSGFMKDTDFVSTSNTLGAKKAGLSPDLDALAAYVASLGQESLPKSPFRNSDGTVTPEAIAGKKIFERLQCQGCHGGESFTDSRLDESLLHDVGTLLQASGKRLGGKLEGIDTPTLLGVWASAPYLHDGSAADLDSVFSRSNSNSPEAEGHIKASTLSPFERQQLIQFLLQLDGNEVREQAPTNTPTPTVTPISTNERLQKLRDLLVKVIAALKQVITKRGLINTAALTAFSSSFDAGAEFFTTQKSSLSSNPLSRLQASRGEFLMKQQIAKLKKAAKNRSKTVQQKALRAAMAQTSKALAIAFELERTR